MRQNILYSISYLALACSLTLQPAFAASSLEDGVKLYNEKHYAKAKPLLEKAVTDAPTSWQANYYLANTYLALGQMSRAKHHYATCQQYCTNASILAHCQAGIARADKHLFKPSAAPKTASKTDGAAEAPESAKAEDKVLSDAELVKQKNRDHIMKLAKEDCDRIKKETKEQIEYEASTHGRRWRNTETGERSFDISDDRKAEIERESEEKCRRIMDEAKRRAAAIR